MINAARRKLICGSFWARGTSSWKLAKNAAERRGYWFMGWEAIAGGERTNGMECVVTPVGFSIFLRETEN